MLQEDADFVDAANGVGRVGSNASNQVENRTKTT